MTNEIISKFVESMIQNMLSQKICETELECLVKLSKEFEHIRTHSNKKEII